MSSSAIDGAVPAPHPPPVQDKPSLPIMDLHEDYHRPEEKEPTADTSDAPAHPPTSPNSTSLFSQLQAAQASSGSAAAATILLARSQELLGMSANPISLIDEPTKERLILEGNELKGYADLLMSTPTASSVASMWHTLSAKYDTAGSGLTTEALNLWTNIAQSTEAKEISEVSWDVIQKWQEYVATTEGHKLLTDSGEMIKSQSGVLASLLQGVTLSLAGTMAPSAPPVDESPVAASAADGALSVPSSSPVVSRSPAPQPLLQKEALLNTTRKINNALADDEDVKELLTRSTNLLKSYSRDPLKDGAGGAPSVTPDSQSGVGSSPDATILAGDAASVALRAGEDYLKSMRESETGSKMLAKGLVLLQQNKELLMPENLTSMGTSLANDVDARQAFVTKTKDIALEFLLSYLPTVVVPPIIGEKDKIAYEIANIDLGGFKVDSHNVIVAIHDNNSIEIKATNIACAMKNLIWKYKKLSFPRLSGHGTADANAADVEFILRLKLAYPNTNQNANATNNTHTSHTKHTTNNTNNADRPETTSRTASTHAAPSPSPSLSPATSRRSSISASQPISSSSSVDSDRTYSTSLADLQSRVTDVVTGQSHSRRGSTAGDANGAAATAPATTPSLPIASPVPPIAAPTSVGQSILDVVSIDLGQPRLVMDSCHVTLKQFDIQIHTGYFKGVYNLLLGLFSDSVKQYLENTLNNELILKSVYLVDTLNVLAVDYLPLLQRIMVKATLAGMADDEQNTTSATSETAATSETEAATSSATAKPTTHTEPTITNSSLASFYS